MLQKINFFIGKIKRSVHQKWYLPLAVLFSYMDAFVPVVPNEVFLVLGVLSRPGSWINVAGAFTLASALGATTLAALIQWSGPYILDVLFPHLSHSAQWLGITSWMQEHGDWGLFWVALSPFPQHAAVALVGLSGVSF